MIPTRPVVIANEIRMRRAAHRGSFLLVEGRDDRLFYQRFINDARCVIVVVQGKEDLSRTIDILDRSEFAGALGVVDADFDLIEGRPDRSGNIIRPANFHDLECILLQSGALDRLLGEFASKDKCARFGRDVREALLAAAYPIGCLRLHSERGGGFLRFAGLNYRNFVNNDLTLNRQALIREVKNQSRRQDLLDADLNHGINAVEAQAHDPWLVCAGPDLMGILSVGLKTCLGNNVGVDVREENLLRSLRLGFADQDFENSEVAQRILRWQDGNLGYTVLR